MSLYFDMSYWNKDGANEIGDETGMMLRCMLWLQNRISRCLNPSVSIKDRTVVGPADRV